MTSQITWRKLNATVELHRKRPGSNKFHEQIFEPGALVSFAGIGIQLMREVHLASYSK